MKIHFLTEEFIQGSLGLTRLLKQPVKHPKNPLISPDKPWEGTRAGGWITVLWDDSENLFKCWYMGLRRDLERKSTFCYAFSQDGIEWTKPQLEIVEFAGSFANNIVFRGRTTEGFALGPNVVKTNGDPPYWMIYWDCGEDPKRGFGVCVASSEDGLRWQPHPENPVLQSPFDRLGGHDDVLCACYDATRERFMLWQRVLPVENLDDLTAQTVRPSGLAERIVAQAESNDCIHWRNFRVVLRPSLDDPPDTQFYGMSGTPYDNGYLGLLLIYHTDVWKMDVELAWSPDGSEWRRVSPRQTFLPNGPEGEWDYGIIHPAAYFIMRDDEIMIYYAGTDSLHGPAHKPDATNLYHVGLATIPKDRLVAAYGRDDRSLLLTKRFRLEGDRLVVNANAQSGELRIEIRDTKFEVIPGHSLEESDPLRTDARRHIATWGGRADLSHLRGRELHLRLLLNRAELYTLEDTVGP